jgi:KTSC domain
VSYLPSLAEPPATAAPETIALPHSSFLQAATYDASQFALTLDFKSGHQVVHRFVFPMVWAQFKEAKSHGSFYATSIKKQYPSVTFKRPLLVSHLTRAIKEHRGSHAST